MARRTDVSKFAPSKELLREINFNFYAPLASRVAVAGTFNQWNTSASLLKRSKEGNWTTTLWLKPGRYEYRYLVDNRWENEQKSNTFVPNAFGSHNNTLEVK